MKTRLMTAEMGGPFVCVRRSVYSPPADQTAQAFEQTLPAAGLESTPEVERRLLHHAGPAVRFRLLPPAQSTG
jgi:hypothetical protein